MIHQVDNENYINYVNFYLNNSEGNLHLSKEELETCNFAIALIMPHDLFVSSVEECMIFGFENMVSLLSKKFMTTKELVRIRYIQTYQKESVRV